MKGVPVSVENGILTGKGLDRRVGSPYKTPLLGGLCTSVVQRIFIIFDQSSLCYFGCFCFPFCNALFSNPIEMKY